MYDEKIKYQNVINIYDSQHWTSSFELYFLTTWSRVMSKCL